MKVVNGCHCLSVCLIGAVHVHFSKEVRRNWDSCRKKTKKKNNVFNSLPLVSSGKFESLDLLALCGICIAPGNWAILIVKPCLLLILKHASHRYVMVTVRTDQIMLLFGGWIAIWKRNLIIVCDKKFCQQAYSSKALFINFCVRLGIQQQFAAQLLLLYSICWQM